MINYAVSFLILSLSDPHYQDCVTHAIHVKNNQKLMRLCVTSQHFVAQQMFYCYFFSYVVTVCIFCYVHTSLRNVSRDSSATTQVQDPRLPCFTISMSNRYVLCNKTIII